MGPLTQIWDESIIAISEPNHDCEEGLGTCILGWFNEKVIKDLLSVPKSKRIALIITLGYQSDGVIRDKKRKPLDTIISYNKY